MRLIRIWRKSQMLMSKSNSYMAAKMVHLMTQKNVNWWKSYKQSRKRRRRRNCRQLRNMIRRWTSWNKYKIVWSSKIDTFLARVLTKTIKMKTMAGMDQANKKKSIESIKLPKLLNLKICHIERQSKYLKKIMMEKVPRQLPFTLWICWRLF